MWLGDDHWNISDTIQLYMNKVVLMATLPDNDNDAQLIPNFFRFS